MPLFSSSNHHSRGRDKGRAAMSTTAAYHMASSSQSVPRKRPATVPDSSLPSGPGGTLSRAGSVSTEGSRRRVLPAARAPVQGGARAAAFYRSPSAETAAAVSPSPRYFTAADSRPLYDADTTLPRIAAVRVPLSVPPPDLPGQNAYESERSTVDCSDSFVRRSVELDECGQGNPATYERFPPLPASPPPPVHDFHDPQGHLPRSTAFLASQAPEIVQPPPPVHDFHDPRDATPQQGPRSAALLASPGLEMAQPPPTIAEQLHDETSRVILARNIVLEDEVVRLRHELTEAQIVHSEHEKELVTELGTMRSCLQTLEHQLAVAEGRCTGLIDAARKQIAEEVTMGGKSEAARLMLQLAEVHASQALLAEKEAEVERLKADKETHDALLLKADSKHLAKVEMLEMRASTAETQATELATALGSLQTLVREQAAFKNEMQDKLQAKCREVSERDRMLSSLQRRLARADTTIERLQQQAREENRALALELGREPKVKVEEQSAKIERLLGDALDKDNSIKDLKAQLRKLEQTATGKENTAINLRDDLDNALNKMALKDTVHERENATLKQQLAALREELDVSREGARSPVRPKSPELRKEKPKRHSLSLKP
ncbi:hypothetical protein DIPPA_35724 [Diplonema papillatum]|nr:hypothetical protein DIPPA_35724 [Diplonema papillatum]